MKTAFIADEARISPAAGSVKNVLVAQDDLAMGW
jgi:hypothetical protein